MHCSTEAGVHGISRGRRKDELGGCMQGLQRPVASIRRRWWDMLGGCLLVLGRCSGNRFRLCPSVAGPTAPMPILDLGLFLSRVCVSPNPYARPKSGRCPVPTVVGGLLLRHLRVPP